MKTPQLLFNPDEIHSKNGMKELMGI